MEFFIFFLQNMFLCVHNTGEQYSVVYLLINYNVSVHMLAVNVHVRVCVRVCACVCACMRACVHACVRVCVHNVNA